MYPSVHEGVLRVVRCSYWLPVHHGKLHRPMGEMVEEPSAGADQL